MLKNFFLFVAISVLFVSAEGLNGGIRNFKFRKKDPSVANTRSEMFKRYLDGEFTKN